MTQSYLLIGHITADLTPEGNRRLGGTVSYGARTARAFDLEVRLLSSVAKNEPLLDELMPYVNAHKIIPAKSTSTFENIYDSQGRRTQYIRGVAASLSAKDVPSEWLSTPLVHLAPLTGEVDPHLATYLQTLYYIADLAGLVTAMGR